MPEGQLPFSGLTSTGEQHLKAAQGWLELGNVVDASAELDNIEPQHWVHPDVMKLRLRIDMKAGRWESAAQLAESLSRLLPGDAEVFVWWSECARRMPEGSILRALELLLDVSKNFPDDALVPFTLARYNTLLENLVEAVNWLNIAFDVAQKNGSLKEWKRRARDESDLEPLFLKL
jgi:tetratricopeptide (TPR) repeat protein